MDGYERFPKSCSPSLLILIAQTDLPVGFAKRLPPARRLPPTTKSEASLYRPQDDASKDHKSSVFQKHDGFLMLHQHVAVSHSFVA
jgi:hypothetical protein